MGHAGRVRFVLKYGIRRFPNRKLLASGQGPWNPDATKNVDPYAESAIVNGASRYSYACSAVKYNPNNTVKNNP